MTDEPLLAMNHVPMTVQVCGPVSRHNCIVSSTCMWSSFQAQLHSLKYMYVVQFPGTIA